MERSRLIAILEALLVTFLWSSSYILVKIGLVQVKPLTLVTLRYVTATIVLVFIVLIKGGSDILRQKRMFLKLSILGLFGYTVAQGLQVLGLYYLPAVTVTFILNFTPVFVIILSALFLGVYPTRIQTGGTILVLVGAFIYFNVSLQAQNLWGVLLTFISGLGWASYLVMSRIFFLKENIEPLDLTVFSMTIGSALMIAITLVIEGIPTIPTTGWGIIFWLGIVNTAVAFFLWNHALQKLEAFEISILQNTMLIQIALLAWVFLGEKLTIWNLVGMTLVFIGAILAQIRRLNHKEPQSPLSSESL